MSWDAEDSARKHAGLAVRNGRYYWQQMVAGRRHNESLGVLVGNQAAERQALRVLAAKRAALQDGRISDYEQMRMKRACSTIGELIAAYGQYAMRRGLTESWRGNPAALRIVVATARGIQPDQVDGLGLDVLTAPLMLAYENKALAAGGGQAAANTIVSRRRKCRALFARKARLGYDLEIPECVEGFLAAGDVQERVQDWERPAATLVSETKAAARFLRDCDCIEEAQAEWARNIQVAYLLCYALALRAKEAAACTWEWFEKMDGQLVCWVKPRLAEGFRPKGRAGYVPVPVAVWEWLQSLRTEGQDHLLAGTDYGRYNFVQREFAQWMREIGWASHHCAHELRRLRGCEWWEDPAVGPALCSEWLRHSTITVTQRHYGKPGLPSRAVQIQL